MKFTVVLAALASFSVQGSFARVASPVAKVMELLGDMQAKITAEGEEEKKLFHEYQEWCEDEARKLGFSLKEEKGELTELSATIEEEAATKTTLSAKVSQLAEAISTSENELKEATALRKKEAEDFAAEGKELSEVIALVGKAIRVLEEHVGKGASMVQLKDASSLTQALGAIVQASMFSSSDAQRIVALESSLEDDAELAAPEAEAYEGHSSGIIETLEGMLEKAKAQLAKIQTEESTALHNFEILKQSLEDEISQAKSDMKKAKSGLAESAESKATAQGELEETTKELSADKKSKADLQAECMEKAKDYEATSNSREEELKALAEAKKAIAESTGAAEKATYGFSQTFLQLGQVTKKRSPDPTRVPFAVVRRLREMAQRQSSAALSQLASRLSTAVSLSTMQGADPFEKVRGLISDLLARLEKEAADDATQKGFCDKEMSETNEKQAKKDTELEKLSTKIDQMAARSEKLKGQVTTLQKDLADIATSQSEMDELRKEEHASFVTKKKELEDGLEGVKLALKVLRDFYGKSSKDHDASGSANGLIAMIEVCESDFSKGLSETITTEDGAQTSYEDQSKDNQVDKAAKSEAVKFKTKEAAGLDKALTELKTDRRGVQDEADAILEYFDKLKGKCVATPTSYEERKKAREDELASLKEALSILEGEEALLQRSAHRTLSIAQQTALKR